MPSALQPPALPLGCGCSIPGLCKGTCPREVPTLGTGRLSCGQHQGLQNVSRRDLSSFVFSEEGGPREGEGNSSLPCPQPAGCCLVWALGTQVLPAVPGSSQETSKKRGLWERRAARGVLWHPSTTPTCVNNHRALGESEAPSQAGPLGRGDPSTSHSWGMPALPCGQPPRHQTRLRIHRRFLSSRTCGQRPDPNLLLAPTSVPRCQPRAGGPELPQEALAALALFLQLGRLRAHRLLRAAVHPGERRVPALGRLERQQRLPHRAPDVLPPRLLCCERPGSRGAPASLIPLKPPRRQHQAKGVRPNTAMPGALRVAEAPRGRLSSLLPCPAGFALSALFSKPFEGTAGPAVPAQSWRTASQGR